MKRILAVISVSAALLGALENPAHSDAIEEAALMAIAAGVCGARVPDSVFLPRVQAVAVKNGVNVTVAMNLIHAQMQIMAAILVETGQEAEFCEHVQNIRFE